jgi:hypothetical protein
MTPHTKSTKSVHELQDFLKDEKQKEYSLVSLFKHFKSDALSKLFRSFKRKGIPFSDAFLKLILMTVGQMTIFRCVNNQGGTAEAGKDAYYSIKNNPMTDWRALVLVMILQFETLKQRSKATVTKGTKCFIADDTAFAKRGKTLEGISRIWDHVFHRSILGFKGLFLAYWDGLNFIPIDFSLHNEKGKNPEKPFGLNPVELKARYRKDRSDNSPGASRLSEIRSSKVKSLISMIHNAISKGITADYVLVDSWFMCEELIRFVFNNPYMFILGMCKMGNARYNVNGKSYDAVKLLEKCKKTMKVKRSRKLKSHYYTIDVGYKGMLVRLFFSQYANQSSWNLLLTDDLHLAYNEAIRIYQIRWGIEVFFKEAKQYLRLGKCQSNDFDAQIADISIIMITYMMLSLKKRFQAYDTIGGVFRDVQNEMIENTLAEKLFGLFVELVSSTLCMLGINPEEFIRVMMKENILSESIINFISENMEENTLRKAS